MAKFQRNYVLTVQLADFSIQVIRPPLTLEFTTHHEAFGSANEGSFVVYGLSEQLRNLIRFDVTNYNSFRSVTLEVGYGDRVSTIFAGNITNAYSVREHDIFKTYIKCVEGGYLFANGIANFTFPIGVTHEQIIEMIIADMSAYGVKKGAIGSYPKTLTRGNAYSGNHRDILNELTGGGFTVQKGKAFVLGDYEYLPGVVEEISPDTGLLNTPKRETTNVHVEMLLEPDIIMLQGIRLKSTTGDSVNQLYKVMELGHSGIISEVVGGKATTTVGLSPVALFKVPT